MKAAIEIECENPDMVIKSLEPEIDESVNFNAKLDSNDNRLLLVIESEKFSGLLAGINSYVKLIRVAKDGMEEIK